MTHYPQLTALSPLDGRYATKTAALQHLMSEYGLIYHRVIVEIDWLITLTQHPEITEAPELSKKQRLYLHQIISEFSEDDAHAIKTIEKTTNHDVKAVEYYLQEKLKAGPELAHYIPFLHFGCTSEDINNLAYALMLKKTREEIITPKLTTLLNTLDKMAIDYAALPMLSRTHGQQATPTTLGKEIRNFEQRLHEQLTTWQHIPIKGKFNGAVGNFNAHIAAYPHVNWPEVSQQFIHNLGLTPNLYTTQIEPHDFIAELMHSLVRINTILIDLCRDFWSYIGIDYFTQRKVANEVGSSTMPHKINPIDFENAEGNLGLANAIANHLAIKLPISRWQRDLTDSTVLRNLGTVFGYLIIAITSLEKGLSKLEINESHIQTEVAACWALLAEPIQTVLRRHGVTDAYEQLKTLTRGATITEADIREFIDTLTIPEAAKQDIIALTPDKYIGAAVMLAEKKMTNL